MIRTVDSISFFEGMASWWVSNGTLLSRDYMYTYIGSEGGVSDMI